MEIRLSEENYYLTHDKKFDQKEAWKSIGIKATACFKTGDIAPWDPREWEDEDLLINCGINSIIENKLNFCEQIPISLELYNIPKVLCMYLTGLEKSAISERGLDKSEILNENTEYKIYDKWVNILHNILWKNYYTYFMQCSNNNEANAKKLAKKIAENYAFNFINIFTNTSLTITTNIASLNLLAARINRFISKSEDNNRFEKLIKPYLEEFYQKLINLKVVMVNSDIHNYNSDFAKKLNIPNDNLLFFKNPPEKSSVLKTVNIPDEYSMCFYAKKSISLSGFCQLKNKLNIKPIEFEKTGFFVPAFLQYYPKLVHEWINDANNMMISYNPYPHGKIIEVGIEGSLSSLLDTLQTENYDYNQGEIPIFYKELLDNYCDALSKKGYGCYADYLKPYIEKYDRLILKR